MKRTLPNTATTRLTEGSELGTGSDVESDNEYEDVNDQLRALSNSKKFDFDRARKLIADPDILRDEVCFALPHIAKSGHAEAPQFISDLIQKYEFDNIDRGEALVYAAEAGCEQNIIALIGKSSISQIENGDVVEVEITDKKELYQQTFAPAFSRKISEENIAAALAKARENGHKGAEAIITAYRDDAKSFVAATKGNQNKAPAQQCVML